MTSNRRAARAYWILVALLFAAQAVYTVGGLGRLWYEEQAESIRNPFWLDHRLVYDGISSNVGWYGLVLLVYKVFGFSPYAAKYVRLALHALCLASAAQLLLRYLGPRRAWLPLAVFGLSPTLLYFDNLGTSYGIDLQLCPVVLLLIVWARDLSGASRVMVAVLHAAIGAVAMLGCLMFPSFLFYLPCLAAVHVWLNRRGIAWTAAGFAAPLAIALLFVRNTSTFVADAAADGAGVFRGGGHALTIDPAQISKTLAQLLVDLFFRGTTYYFAIPDAEFSGVLGLIGAGGIILGSVAIAWVWKPARVPLVLAGLLCVASIAGVSLTQKLPGLRRATGFVSGFYVVAACAWAAPPSLRGGVSRAVIVATQLACLLLLVHHGAVYRGNYRYLAGETRRMNDVWFSRFGTADESVRTWAQEWVAKGKPLSCPAASRCRYSEIFAAVAGYLHWNGLGEPAVMATDPDSGRVTQLTLQSPEPE